jgi:4-oxalocrotonate tautomerase
MPFIRISMYSGRPHELKKKLAHKVTDATSETLDIPKDYVQVVFDEIPKSDWAVGGELPEQE